VSFDLPEVLRSEYPFRPHHFDLDGMRYSYLDEGTGPVLLFVHGNPTWSFAWRNLIQAFSSEYRCIAVDHIGMGLSDKPKDYEYRIDQHIDNLTRLVQELELKDVTLIGHDWGGCIGMGAAGRDASRYKQFVMMNTAAFRSTRIPFRIALCRIPFLGPMGVRGFNLFAGAAVNMAVENRMPRRVRKGYLHPYDSWGNRIAVQRFVEEIPLNPSHPTYETLVSVEEGLAQFESHPMQLIWGEQDWCFTTAFLAEWEERFPHAQTLRLPEAGHYLFEDDHDAVLGQIQLFLNEKASED